MLRRLSSTPKPSREWRPDSELVHYSMVRGRAQRPIIGVETFRPFDLVLLELRYRSFELVMPGGGGQLIVNLFEDELRHWRVLKFCVAESVRWDCRARSRILL
jgi:hypothetical protein